MEGSEGRWVLAVGVGVGGGAVRGAKWRNQSALVNRTLFEIELEVSIIISIK